MRTQQNYYQVTSQTKLTVTLTMTLNPKL